MENWFQSLQANDSDDQISHCPKLGPRHVFAADGISASMVKGTLTTQRPPSKVLGSVNGLSCVRAMLMRTLALGSLRFEVSIRGVQRS